MNAAARRVPPPTASTARWANAVYGVSVKGGGKYEKADTINAELKAGAYNTLEQTSPARPIAHTGRSASGTIQKRHGSSCGCALAVGTIALLAKLWREDRSGALDDNGSGEGDRQEPRPARRPRSTGALDALTGTAGHPPPRVGRRS